MVKHLEKSDMDVIIRYPSGREYKARRLVDRERIKIYKKCTDYGEKWTYIMNFPNKKSSDDFMGFNRSELVEFTKNKLNDFNKEKTDEKVSIIEN